MRRGRTRRCDAALSFLICAQMNNVVIDDRRIKVDFSQSVSKLWKGFRRYGKVQNASQQQEGQEERASANAGGGRRDPRPADKCVGRF